MACDIDTIQRDACESGIACVTETRKLLIIIAQLLCEINEGGGGGGGGGDGQIKSYDSSLGDPNTLGIVPDDQTKDAWAYAKDGSAASFGWNTSTLVWN